MSSAIPFEPGVDLHAPAAVPRPTEARWAGEGACHDLPPEVGWYVVGVNTAILVAFAVTFLGSAETLFVLGVCAAYLAAYVGVPIVMLRIEAEHRDLPRTPYAAFLQHGLLTLTGRVSAGAALAQILTVPLCLFGAAAGIGLIFRLTFA